MSKVFIIQDSTLYFNSFEFDVLFNHIDFFKPFEIKHYDECFVNHGMKGVNLLFVSKETFNIFYLRFSAVFDTFTDNYERIEKSNLYKEVNEDYNYFSSKFKLILHMLEKDKRYDSEWIREYKMKTVMQDCMEPYQPQK